MRSSREVLVDIADKEKEIRDAPRWGASVSILNEELQALWRELAYVKKMED